MPSLSGLFRRSAVNFSVVAGVISLAVLALVVGIVALWPRRR